MRVAGVRTLFISFSAESNWNKTEFQDKCESNNPVIYFFFAVQVTVPLYL